MKDSRRNPEFDIELMNKLFVSIVRFARANKYSPGFDWLVPLIPVSTPREFLARGQLVPMARRGRKLSFSLGIGRRDGASAITRLTVIGGRRRSLLIKPIAREGRISRERAQEVRRRSGSMRRRAAKSESLLKWRTS